MADKVKIEDFSSLSLSEPIIKAIADAGYETPSPIQAEMIPHILQGRDVLGQAQTGTGKTAAFALPLLEGIDLMNKQPQVLVLAPTRELAIQVAEAFQSYARYFKGFRVSPIYGGQDFRPQLRRLKNGLHVVVGTPGRVMDHMRRGTLKLDRLKCLVLDEADEMLRMGFLEDVEWILEQSPEGRQIALFSATIPKEIRRIAKKHLNNPKEITIKKKTTTADLINQRCWIVKGTHKLDALTRILEVEAFDAMLCFVRTKTAAVELAEKLNARGFAAAALNGDIPQKQREQTVERLRTGALDIVVATDVAARGLDVDRISHVINYDIPYDTEAYIHRIGRTGRAGRSGEAILFAAPREMRMLTAIERATKQKIELMELPSNVEVSKKRIADFKNKVSDMLEAKDLPFFASLVEEIQKESKAELLNIAGALARLAQEESVLIPKKEKAADKRQEKKQSKRESESRKKFSKKSRFGQAEKGMQRYRLEVGRIHKVNPGSIVGAIANEADLDSEYIGAIRIYDTFSTVDLPQEMPKEIFRILQKTHVAGRKLKLSLDKGAKSSFSPGSAKSKSKARASSKSKGGKKKKSKEGVNKRSRRT